MRRLYRLRSEAGLKFKFDAPRGGLFGGNRDDLIEQVRKIEEAIEAEHQRLLDQIRAEGDDTVDRPMITLWDEFSKLKPAPVPAKDADDPAAAFLRRRNALLQQMAQRMGALPLQGDRPEPGSNLTAIRFGRVFSEDRWLNLFVTFSHAHEGLPVVADWLSQRGNGEVRYEFMKEGDDETP